MATGKYPRTLHFPSSPGITSDDKVVKNLDHFDGREVIYSVKCDGENSTLRPDKYHARSLDSAHHPSQDWLSAFHGRIAHEIPEGWRICGENMYAKHSIEYQDLPSYFLGFSVWDQNNVAISWDDTLEIFELLNIVPVPVLRRGIFLETDLDRLVKSLDLTKDEGIVVRLADSFKFEDFSTSVAKWVRADHVQSNSVHWRTAVVIPNKLAK
jgi:hypothetical protein